MLALARLDVVHDPGCRQRQVLTEATLTLLPVDVALVAARAEPVVPRTLKMLEDHFQHFELATDTRVLVRASPLRTERPIRLLERVMAVCTTPWPTLLHPPTEAFPDRLALAAPVSLACGAPRGGQSENGTCPRAPGRWVAAWRPLAGHQHRFLRMPGEAAARTPLRQDLHPPAGVGFPRAAADELIGQTRQKARARPPGLDVCDQPCVQDLMQAYRGAPGRNDPTWWRPLVGVSPRSRLQHARGPPRATPAESASLLDPLLDTRPPRAPGQVSENSPAIRLDSPGDGQRPALLPPLVPRLMGAVALPEALGHSLEILLDDRLEAPHPRPLDPLGRDAGGPSGPLRPSVLFDPYPLDGRRPLPIIAAPLLQGPQGLVQVFGVLLRPALVHTWGTALLGLVRGFPQALPVNHVQHLVEPPRRRALGLLCHALELPGDGG